MGWWLGCPVQRSDRILRRHNYVAISSYPVQLRVIIHVFVVEVAGHQDQQFSAETSDQVRSDQWAGRRELSRKNFHRSAG